MQKVDNLPMDSASQILEIAERQMRKVGYNAVSFRDIASEVGIKSASLHYHFPKKEDLGVALVQNYSEKFYAHLTAKTQNESRPEKRIAGFVDIFRHELEDQRLICLCAILGAEAPSLPNSVSNEVRNFFDKNITWLTLQYDALGFETPASHAKTSLALLEGAMVISAVNDDISIFEAATKSILNVLP